MSTTIPFSYHLFHTPTQKHYYGIKYARGCNPADLWTKYFSTSASVKNLIAEYGADSFIATVRRTFSNGAKALLWEHKVLRRLNAAGRDDWINRHNGGKKFRAPEHHSNATKEILRKKITGLKRKDSTKVKLSSTALEREKLRRENDWQMPAESTSRALVTRKQRIADGTINPYSTERNKKMGDSKRGAKRKYLLDGSFIMVKS